ncbi:hypothetical protein [Nocardia sp. NPDC050435]|uniref:hypothetical protein n=1 Tax=Nocardia sp. NPDC050435 TaxID=3155040 RepID=UPI0033C40B7D
MRAEVVRYLTAVGLDPAYQGYLPEHERPRGPILIVGHHAAFARNPRPGTALASFPGTTELTETRYPAMGLVRVEQAIERRVVAPDGTTSVRWEEAVFPGLPTGILWQLLPAERDPATGRWVIAAGTWAAGARRGLLPAAVRALVPGAPEVVALYDHNPHTGRRWPS